MKKEHSFKILILLVFFSSALIGTLLPMAEEITLALPGLTSQAQVGFICSIFLLVGALSSLVWAILSTKYSRKNLLVVSTLEWSVFTFLTVFARDFLSLLVLQVLSAIGFGAVIPITFSLIVDLTDPEKRGRAFGIKEMFYVLGIGFSQALSGFLIENYPWFVPFLIISAGGFICTILLLMMTPPEKGEKDKQYKPIIESDSLWIRKKDLKDIIERRSNILILGFNFALFIAIGAISQFLITMLKNDTDYNFDSTTATIFMIIIFVSQVPSGILIGNIGDRQYRNDQNGRMKVVLFCLLIGSVLYITGYLLAFTAISPPIIIIAFLAITTTGAFFFGGIDPLVQATLGEINSPQTRSTIYSLSYLTYTFGRSISELILVILFLGFGYYRVGYIVLSILALGCTLLLIPVLRVLPRDLDKTWT